MAEDEGEMSEGHGSCLDLSRMGECAKSVAYRSVRSWTKVQLNVMMKVRARIRVRVRTGMGVRMGQR